jgi:hypothetical protein
MLRSALLFVGGMLLAAGLVLLAAGYYPGGAWCAFTGGLLVAGIVFERVIYKPVEQKTPGPGWEKTSERFLDERSGKPVTVYVQPATGERKYVDE